MEKAVVYDRVDCSSPEFSGCWRLQAMHVSTTHTVGEKMREDRVISKKRAGKIGASRGVDDPAAKSIFRALKTCTNFRFVACKRLGEEYGAE